MELTGKIQAWGDPDPRNRLTGVALAVLFHVVAIGGLLQHEPARSAFTGTIPIIVSVITPLPVVEKRQEPPKPLPVTPRVQLPQQINAATTEAPQPVLAPAYPPLSRRMGEQGKVMLGVPVTLQAPPARRD